MSATLRHRGPDDEGYYVDGPVALGHRRLQIIDLATGRQPIANETGTVHAMLNGEIYNYRSLTETLRARGHRFTTSSDTEVIVHAWEEFGDGLPRPLQRDVRPRPLGRRAPDALRRPRPHGREAPLLRRAQRVVRVRLGDPRPAGPSRDRPRPRSAGLARYLTSGYLPDPHTILEGVRKLPAGHSLTVAARPDSRRPVLGPALRAAARRRARRRATRAHGRGAVGRAVHVGAAPPGQRRARRDLPERRHRLERRHRGRAWRWRRGSASRASPSASRSRATARSRSPGRSRSTSAPSTTSSPSPPPTRPRCCRSWATCSTSRWPIRRSCPPSTWPATRGPR